MWPDDDDDVLVECAVCEEECYSDDLDENGLCAGCGEDLP